jgi:hypothetical protein
MKIGKVFFFFTSIYFIVHLMYSFFILLSFRCDDCKESDREHCYHWFVGDELSIATFQADLEAQLDAYIANCGISFDYIKSKTKIKYEGHTACIFG